jgi:hypothetical protein
LQIIVSPIVNFLNENLNTILRKKLTPVGGASCLVTLIAPSVPLRVLGIPNLRPRCICAALIRSSPPLRDYGYALELEPTRRSEEIDATFHNVVNVPHRCIPLGQGAQAALCVSIMEGCADHARSNTRHRMPSSTADLFGESGRRSDCSRPTQGTPIPVDHHGAAAYRPRDFPCEIRPGLQMQGQSDLGAFLLCGLDSCVVLPHSCRAALTGGIS